MGHKWPDLKVKTLHVDGVIVTWTWLQSREVNNELIVQVLVEWIERM